jgi:capsule biosynthesis phosphatase
MNIIIPLGGLGERFKQEQYSFPKPLIMTLGKQMIFHLLDNLVLTDVDKVYMIINRDLEKYNFSEIVKGKYPRVVILYLDKQTEGAVETVLLGLNQMINAVGKAVLLDCDNFYTTDILKTLRSQDANSIVYFEDHQANPIYSYLLTDNKGVILQIKEKQKISNLANTGCYCFRDINQLKAYCVTTIEKNIRQRNEYYLSGLVQKMIDDGEIFLSNKVDIEDYHCLGTPFQLKLYCNKKVLEGEKKRMCFDLDGTLVTMPRKVGDYSTVEPLIKNIEYLRFLKKIGHTIIIYTARRMKTFSGNVGKVIQDVGKITLDTLEKFGIPYDEIYFGKPYADFYIDDLAVNANLDLEKEVGIYKMHIQERSYNEIQSSKIEVITKKSTSDKIKGEIFWYKNMPVDLRDLFPALISSGPDFYTMEKINGITLSYLYVNESLSEPIFTKFLDAMRRIHTHPIPSTEGEEMKVDIYSNYTSKLEERYKQYDYGKFIDADKVYNRIKKGLQTYEEKKLGSCCMIHGDPVFSNVLIDNNNNIKMIDMRGMMGLQLTTVGDVLYDLSKIYQSLIGYDEILLDKVISSTYKKKLLEVFKTFVTTHYGDVFEWISIITQSLLFTLIPLHNNEKCSKYYQLI